MIFYVELHNPYLQLNHICNKTTTILHNLRNIPEHLFIAPIFSPEFELSMELKKIPELVKKNASVFPCVIKNGRSVIRNSIV